MTTEAVLQAWSNKKFEYGRVDCCKFVAAVIEDKTGVDPMRNLNYSDKKSASKLIDACGSLEEIMRKILGDPIQVDQAKTGDAVLVAVPGAAELAGVLFNGLCAVTTKTGLVTVSKNFARLAWAI